jgi:hypothetical protein
MVSGPTLPNRRIASIVKDRQDAYQRRLYSIVHAIGESWHDGQSNIPEYLRIKLRVRRDPEKYIPYLIGKTNPKPRLPSFIPVKSIVEFSLGFKT